jgi:predicted metalloprotease with PDZ domain
MRYVLTALLAGFLVMPAAGQAQDAEATPESIANQIQAVEAELAELTATMQQAQAQLAQTRAALHVQEQQLQEQLALMEERQRLLAREKIRLAEEHLRHAADQEAAQALGEYAAARALLAQGENATEEKWIIGISVSEPGDEEGGVLVDSLIEEAPAAGAGIKQGDRIVAVNGIPMTKIEDLTSILQIARATEITVTVRRSEEGEVTMKVTPRKEEPEAAWEPRYTQTYQLWRALGEETQPQWQVIPQPDDRMQQLEERIRALEEALRAKEGQPEPNQ